MMFFSFIFLSLLILLIVGDNKSLVGADQEEFGDYGIPSKAGKPRMQRMSFLRVGKGYPPDGQDETQLHSIIDMVPLPVKLSGRSGPSFLHLHYIPPRLRNGKRTSDTDLFTEEMKKASSFATFPRIGKMDKHLKFNGKYFDFPTDPDRLGKRGGGDPKASSNGMWFGPRIGRSSADMEQTQIESAYPLVYVMLNGNLMPWNSPGFPEKPGFPAKSVNLTPEEEN